MKEHFMKIGTGYKVKKAMPYVLSALAAAAVFAATRHYAEFCESLGFDAGIDSTMRVMKEATPDMYEEFRETVNDPRQVFYR